MKFEHLALNLTDPLAASEWYEKRLGMKAVRKVGPPTHTHFMADRTGRVVLEIYHNPNAPAGSYGTMDPLVLHLAFAVDDIEAEHARLVAAGAEPQGEIAKLANGDKVAMLRDPWGLPLQLVQRAVPMA